MMYLAFEQIISVTVRDIFYYTGWNVACLKTVGNIPVKYDNLNLYVPSILI